MPDMTLIDGLEPVCHKYLQRRRAMGKEDRTVDHDRIVLRRVTRYVGGPLLYVEYDALVGWQVARSAAISSGSLRAEMSVIRGFYTWAAREGLISADPTVRLDMPRLRRYLPRPMAEDKIRTALAAADKVTMAMLGLGALAGARCCEVAALSWADVDRGQMLIRLTGKGRRERVVPLAPELLDILDALPLPHRGPVIRRRDGGSGHNRAHTISHWINPWLHSIGFDETFHQLRHAFATCLLEETEDLRMVQEALGHASPATTSVYTMVRPSRMRAGVDAAATAMLGRVG